MARKISGKTPKAYFRSGIPVPERPWYALTDSQKELRLDTVAWHEGHDIFLHELLEHPVKRVRSCASSTNQGTMKLMIRAYKQGMDLAQVPLGTLIGTPWKTGRACRERRCPTRQSRNRRPSFGPRRA